MRSIASVLLAAVLCTSPAAFAQVASAPDSGANPWTHLNFQNDPDQFQFAIIAETVRTEYTAALIAPIYRIRTLFAAPGETLRASALVKIQDTQAALSR